jgi:RNA polymerase sigma factor (sigma-70 family)
MSLRGKHAGADRPAAGIAQLLLGMRGQRAAGPGDGQLLRRFLSQRDEAAFTSLVQRHGPMVLGVCRRVLSNAADAEDAFQATFLVLARNAPSLARRGVLGDWLHGVARRTALSARRLAARRRTKERAMARAEADTEMARNDWLPLLDEELQRLPANYRLPIVLCELEGHTRREAAERLGWPEGTVAGRLARGRALLAERLVRRGAMLSPAAMGAALSPNSVAAGLVVSTVKAATRGVISAPVAALTQDVVKTMFLGKLKSAGVALGVLTTVVLGCAALADSGLRGASDLPQAPVAEPASKDEQQPGAQPHPVDQFGDPLPREALARLGTIRLRHGNMVLGIVFAPDGKSLASAGEDGAVHCWQTATGRELLRIESDLGLGLGSVEALAYSPDGGTLAGTRLNQAPCLWDVATGREFRQFGGPQRRARWLSFSPDGKLLAYGGHSDQAGVWLAEVSSGKELRHFAALWLVFSPNGKALAYGGANADPMVHVEDAATGKALHRLAGQPIRVAFSPDGPTLATADDQTLRLVDLATGQTREIARPEGQAAGGDTLMFSPDGTTLAALGGRGKLLRIVAVGPGKTIRAIELNGKRENIRSMLYTRDGKTVITGHEGGHVSYWIASTGAKASAFRAHSFAAHRLALSPDGQTLATTAWYPHGGDYSVRLWETATGKPLALPLGPQMGVRMLAFSPDGRRAATATSTGGTQLWETATGKLLRRWQAFGPLAFAADGQNLICGGWQDGKVRVLDIATGEELRQFHADTKNHISALDLSRDGRWLATNGSDQVVRLWATASWRQLHDFGGPQQGYVYNLALSPDGKLLAGNNETTILLWDTRTGKLVGEYTDPESRHISAISFSGDGRLLASSHMGHLIPSARPYYVKVRDLAIDKELGRWATPGLDTIALSPDGRTLAGGGQHSRELLLLEVATGQVRRQFQGHQGGVSRVAFAPNGRALASGSADGTALVWDLTGARSRQHPVALTYGQLDALWNDLRAENAAVAYEAMCTLQSAPDQSVSLFARHLRTVPKLDAKRLAEALAKLDRDDFTTRNRATQELEALGEAAEPALRRALADKPTVEVSRRLERLLSRFEGAEAWRTGRAMEVLEQIGDSAARRLLHALAQGSPDARLTHDARAALDRLGR